METCSVPTWTALSAFLAAGPPPIVFTLGSFVVHAADDFYTAGAAMARGLERCAVLLVGDHAVARHRVLATPDIFVAGRVPHAALFPRAAAVVHHGGIGTVAQASRAGVPQLVCPFFGDQFDNAEHLQRLGIATALPLTRFQPLRGAALPAPLLASSLTAARGCALGKAVTADDRRAHHRFGGRPPPAGYGLRDAADLAANG